MKIGWTSPERVSSLSFVFKRPCSRFVKGLINMAMRFVLPVSAYDFEANQTRYVIIVPGEIA